MSNRQAWREQTFSRLLLQYKNSGRIVLDDRAVTDIREAYDMREHNLQIVEGETLATRLGWDEAGIEQLRLLQAVLNRLSRSHMLVKTTTRASLTFANILDQKLDASGKSHGQISRGALAR
jgi:hypothetical protein